MRKKVIAAVFIMLSTNAYSYQLPDTNGVLGQCNKFANSKAGEFIIDNGIKFRDEVNTLGGRKEVKGFNVMDFYSAISATCSVAHSMALHGTPAPNAIPMAADSVKSTMLSLSTDITEEMAEKILYQAAIYGYSL